MWCTSIGSFSCALACVAGGIVVLVPVLSARECGGVGDSMTTVDAYLREQLAEYPELAERASRHLHRSWQWHLTAHPNQKVPHGKRFGPFCEGLLGGVAHWMGDHAHCKRQCTTGWELPYEDNGRAAALMTLRLYSALCACATQYSPLRYTVSPKTLRWDRDCVAAIDHKRVASFMHLGILGKRTLDEAETVSEPKRRKTGTEDPQGEASV